MSNVGDPGVDQLADQGRRHFVIGFDQNLAGLHVDHVGGDIRAFEIVGGDLHLLDFGLLKFLVDAGGDLAALRHYGFAALGDGEGKLVAQQTLGDLPEQLLVLDNDVAALVERAQNLGVGLQSQRAQEHRAVELALAVDADVQDNSCCRTRTPPSFRGRG